jgi:hypothetical protein
MTEIIGLSGWARTGKDTVAAHLVEKYGFTRMSFAEPMREALLRLDPMVDAAAGFSVRVSDVIEKYGWDGYKESPYGLEIRTLLQLIGTEVGREMFGADFWVNYALNSTSDKDKVVFADVRFQNEADAIKRAGGKVIRVERDGVGPANDHVSEHDLNQYDFDATIYNDLEVEHLHANIDLLMNFGF